MFQLLSPFGMVNLQRASVLVIDFGLQSYKFISYIAVHFWQSARAKLREVELLSLVIVDNKRQISRLWVGTRGALLVSPLLGNRRVKRSPLHRSLIFQRRKLSVWSDKSVSRSHLDTLCFPSVQQYDSRTTGACVTLSDSRLPRPMLTATCMNNAFVFKTSKHCIPQFFPI